MFTATLAWLLCIPPSRLSLLPLPLPVHLKPHNIISSNHSYLHFHFLKHYIKHYLKHLTHRAWL